MRIVLQPVGAGKFAVEPSFGDMRSAGVSFDEISSGDPLAILAVAYRCAVRTQVPEVAGKTLDDFLDGIPFDGVDVETDDEDPTGAGSPQ